MSCQFLDCESDILEVTNANQQWDLPESSEEEVSASSDEPEEMETFVRSASSRKRLATMKDPMNARLGKKGVFAVMCAGNLSLSKMYVMNRRGGH